MNEKIEALKNLIQRDSDQYQDANGWPHDLVSIKPGRKYTKIDVATRGYLMIENATGEIYGIKAYGVIHRGHHYGNLDTINEWFWGEYYPRIKGENYVM